MKTANSLKIVLVSLAMFWGLGATAFGDFIVNGDMESNTEGVVNNWTLSSVDKNYPGAGEYTTDAYHSATHSLKLYNTTEGTGAKMYWTQICENIEAGRTYTLSGYLKSDNVTGASAYLQVLFYNASNNLVAGYTASPSLTGTADWTYTSKTIEAPVGAVKAKILFGFYLTQGTAWADDISFVPEPATAMLCLCGTGLLISRRLRKNKTL